MTEFTVVNHATEKTFVENSRADAESRKTVGLEEFGFAKSDIDIVQGGFESYEDVQVYAGEPETDGGSTEVINSPEPSDTGGPDVVDTAESDLPDRDVSDDPFEWMPGHFVDTIEGKPAINRKGYAVLSEFYDISVTSDVVVGPEETDFTYCRCEATAIDADGREYRANGSAHVERGDDMELLLEMADTRATKRVLAIATGVGAVSVSELKSEL